MQCVAILGRPEYAGTRQPHGTVPQTLHWEVAESERAGLLNAEHRSPDLHAAIHDYINARHVRNLFWVIRLVFQYAQP